MANEDNVNYLGGLCDYHGPGSDLPAGGNGKIPGWGPEKAAYRWAIMDAEEEAGYSLKKAAELKKDDFIIGVMLNKNVLTRLLETYTENFYQIRDANNVWLSPAEWMAKYKTDGLGLVAIRNKRLELQGLGVTAHPNSGQSFKVGQ